MTNYIQFPRYCLYLIPNENFTHDFNVFCKENSINSSSLNESIYGFHSTVKAPFYLSHLYTEDSLIKKFQNIDTQIIHSLLSNRYFVNKIEYFKKLLVLKLDQNNNFDFVTSSLMRDFDIFRKTLNSSEIKKDIKRFDQLSDKEKIYFQIWGYPYYFECSFHHVTLPIYQKEKRDYLNSIREIKYEKISLLKQNSPSENFKEITSLS
ncbi:DUF1045 domain-containing protein [Alphaproteobacteria bacterium]|nr:DUF1045 domain-containing protein [Alphaproteobacteria bacterium]